MSDTCENCGASIGKLETPCVWRGRIVCARCRDRLAAAPLARMVHRPEPDALQQLAAARAAALSYAPARAPARGASRSLVALGVFAAFCGAVWMAFAAWPSPPAARAVRPVPAAIAPPPPIAAPAPLDVAASDLAAVYARNEVDGDAAYKHRLLRVTGTAAMIRKDFLGHPFVVLEGVIGHDVNCYFPPGSDGAVRGASPGESADIEGECEGMMLGDVILDGCRGAADEPHGSPPFDPRDPRWKR